MGRGIFNIVMGGLLIAGGASGKLTLIGTQSTTALIAVGVLACAYGGWGIWRTRPR